MYALVEALRLHFNQKYSDNVRQGLYDSRDVDRLMTSDKYAEAFIRHEKGIAKQAADMCHKALKWRKEYGLNDLTDASFPEELLNKGAMFFRNQDKDENPIMYFKIKEHKKNPATLPLIQRYMVYLLDREDRRCEGRQVVVLFDMTGAGVGNLDLDLIKFLITCFEDYFPDYLAYLLVFDMPWILNAAWKIIKAWLSEDAKKKVLFVRGQEVFDHIDKENLFVHMGGSDDYTFKYEANGLDKRNKNQNHWTSDDVTSSVTPSPTDSGKHVTFSREDPTVFTSLINDSEEVESSESGSPRGKNLSQNNFQLKIPAGGKTVKHRDDSTFVGSLITIEPGEELMFAPQASTSSKEPVYQAVLVLTNPSTQLRTAYKVKTTSPEKYKVRPSIGMIKPGQGTEVTVYLTATQHDISKDKFLVMAMEVEDGFISSGELAEVWRSASKAKILEHRLRCSMALPPVEVKVEEAAVTHAKLDELELSIRRLTSQLDAMVTTNKELETQVRSLNKGQKILVFVFVCFALLVIVTTYHRLANIQYFARNRSSSYFSCLHP